MQDRTPGPPNGGNPIPDFTPVPRLKPRHDGWTPERQRAFIEALAATGSVTDASKSVNMAPKAPMRSSAPTASGNSPLPGTQHWISASARLSDLAIDRIRHGTPVPVFYKGEQCGERRNYNERLHWLLLRNRMPQTYGPPQQHKPSAAQTDAQREQWQREYTEKNEDKAKRWIDQMFVNIDRVRGAILRRCAADPDLQRAWELLCGETDWSRIPGWQPGEPTQFARDNLSTASMHIMLAQRLEEGSDVTVGDLVFRGWGDEMSRA